jgi:hypothetical protein
MFSGATGGRAPPTDRAREMVKVFIAHQLMK